MAKDISLATREEAEELCYIVAAINPMLQQIRDGAAGPLSNGAFEEGRFELGHLNQVIDYLKTCVDSIPDALPEDP